jgi:hypothetical protein
MGWPAYKEFYLYAIEDPAVPNNTPTGNIWIGMAAAVLENMIEVKWADRGVVQYSGGILPWIQGCWLVGLGVLGLRYFWLLFCKDYGGRGKKVRVFKDKVH